MRIVRAVGAGIVGLGLLTGCALEHPPIAPGRPSASSTVAAPLPSVPATSASPIAEETTASAPGSTPPVPKEKPRAVNCAKEKCVALTFDDGPGPYTRALLTRLADASAPATFFVVGERVAAYPGVAKAIATAGHEIDVHTWDHRDLTTLTRAQIDHQLRASVRVIRRDAGVDPRYLRPSYGAMNAKVHAAARHAGLALALWSVDTLDWRTHNVRRTVAVAVRQATRGSIILLHDIHATSVRAVRPIIDRLRTKGFTFVTVSTLLGKTKPGTKYFHG